jgi:hypothetical protein
MERLKDDENPRRNIQQRQRLPQMVDVFPGLRIGMVGVNIV